jgi:hypothetical protein
MKKILNLIIILAIISNLPSCDKKDANTNSLIGAWHSLKIDSLIHYIVPIRDSVFHSVVFQNNTLEINNDGSFQLNESADTIYGSWIRFKKDSLSLTNNNKRGKYLFDSKIVFIDNDNLTLSYNYGYIEVYFDFDDSTHIVLNTINDIKIYYRRK